MKIRAWVILLLLPQLIAGCILSATAAPFELISGRGPFQAPPSGGSGDSWGPILSADGRYVLFASAANNLLLSSSNAGLPVTGPPKLNVFLRDRTNGSTTLASVNLNGVGGNGDSIPTAISTNGRYACFESAASDLIAGDTNGVTDVFVRDLASNVTFLVSARTNGVPGNGVCRGSTMTPDGRYVAFVSAATNLVANDTNGIPDVFVRDLQLGQTTLVSVGAKNTNSYVNCSSEAPDITPDGRYVAFFSTATNLVAGVTNGGEVYVRDLVAGITIWASTNARSLSGMTNPISYNQAISADGKFVVFQTSTNPLVSISPRGVILRYNLETGLTDRVNTNAYSPAENPEDIRSLDMTPDGRFIAFIAGNSTTNAIYVWDGQSATTALASGNLSNAVAAGAICDWPAIDASGRFVAFLSSATNMVTNSVPSDYHLYLRDLQLSTTTLVDADTNGNGASVGPGTTPRLSNDGRVIAFERLDGDLVADDRNHAYDVFLRDSLSGVTELISARHPTLPSATANGPSAGSVSISADARFVAFGSDADNAVLGDTNGFRDIFVRDRFNGTTARVSVGTNGSATDGISSEPSISDNGRYVAFTSSADNLVPGDTNRTQDVFVRDLVQAETTLVSVKASGTGPGNKESFSPVLSADGRYVLFWSKATDLAGGSLTNNLFLRDLQSNVTYALTTAGVLAAAMTRDGRFIAFSKLSGNVYLWDTQISAPIFTNATGPVLNLAVSPDGNRIVYALSNGLYVVERAVQTTWQIGPALSGSRAGLRFSADGRFLAYAALTSNTNQVYLYNFQTRSNHSLSKAFGGGAPNGVSDSPDISADGRFIAYRSAGTNLLAAPDTNDAPDLFLYDQTLGTTELLSLSKSSGAPAGNRSLAPVFSADGRTLVFQSWASDLVSLDFNQSKDVFVLSLLYASIRNSTPGQGPTLTWPARPGETYHVQFKNTLSDGVWQEVSGTVTVTGNQASLIDLSPGAGQRFYRVVTF